MPRVPRFVALLVAVVALLTTGPAASAALPPAVVPVQIQAQTAAETRATRAAGAAARAISRLEGAGDYAAVARRMHPDSQAVAPAAAVVGWYEGDLAGRRTAELTVTGVEFVAWTWEVTGRAYPRTAAVSFVQPFWTGGVREDVAGVVHLVEADGNWGWFFGNSRAFVDEQIARFAPAAAPAAAPAPDPEIDTVAVEYTSAFPLLDADVDLFWAGAFAARGVPYAPPAGLIGFDEPVRTGCGRAAPEDAAAFYCPADGTIYYVGEFRRLIENRVGDFGWETVVAHEWGHHVQARLGLLGAGTLATDGEGDEVLPVEVELQADCLAGAYTRDAERRDWLDGGDLEEALLLTRVAGDPDGTAVDDPDAHGTGEQRVEAFTDGYDDGIAGCDLPL